MGVSFYYIATRALDLITVILPPALPATLSVGVASALTRLKKEKILCINPSKLNVASKIDRICFDKTGTLTEEGLKIHQVIPCKQRQAPAEFEARNCSLDLLKDTNYDLFLLMGLCHSLRFFAGRIIGDPLEVEMFNFTGCNFPNKSMSSFEVNKVFYQIIKEYEFLPDLRRMSVLVRISCEGHMLFTKGSPECIKSICVPSSSTRLSVCFVN